MLIIPLIVFSIIGILFRDKKGALLSTLIALGSCGLILLVISMCMRFDNFNDIEYRSYYFTKIRHEDPWNERVRRTRTVKVGKRTHVQVYYVTVHHSDSWYIYDNGGDRSSISKEKYEELKNLWNTPMRFVDMHRHYYTINGDAQEYDWCGERECLRGYTESCIYENRVKGSESVLRYREISKEEAKDLGLKEYDINNHVLGMKLTKEERQSLNFFNCYYGREKEIHLLLLAFPSSSGVGIVEDQKAYWQGGNKNELIVCVGLEPGTRNIKWTECFSWQDEPVLDCKIKNYLIERKYLDVNDLTLFVERNLGDWHRKEFEDFNYIQTYLNHKQRVILLWIIIGLTVGGGILQTLYLKDDVRL